MGSRYSLAGSQLFLCITESEDYRCVYHNVRQASKTSYLKRPI